MLIEVFVIEVWHGQTSDRSNFMIYNGWKRTQGTDHMLIDFDSSQKSGIIQELHPENNLTENQISY